MIIKIYKTYLKNVILFDIYSGSQAIFVRKKALEKVCSSLNKNSFQESIQLQKDKEQFYKRKKKLENEKEKTL